MNTLKTDYLTAHCQRNGWELITFTDSHVVFKRSYSPAGDGLYYGTIEYNREWSGLCHGHYDMTLTEAMESARQRTADKLGPNALNKLTGDTLTTNQLTAIVALNNY